MNRVKIPDGEYKERVAKAAGMLAERGIDAMLVCGIEGDFQNVKYFTGMTPIWERLGVVITAAGDSAMLTGPEGLTYCEQFCKLDKIFSLNCFRSSADPIPGAFRLDTFEDVFFKLGLSGGKLKIALGNPIDITLTIYEGLKEAMPQTRIVRAPEIMRILRATKSENEIACLKESYRLVELATQACLEQIRPGMTECNLLGIAHSVIFAHGAQTEGMPNYVFSDSASRHPLGRAADDRELRRDSFLQLGLSASVDGYCGSIGVPVSLGKFTDKQRRLVEFGFEVHKWVRKNAKAGINMAEFRAQYKQKFIDAGMENHYVYGPLHGVGLAEVEEDRPNDYDKDYNPGVNYTYQMDNFLLEDDFGFRWETGIRMLEGGNEFLSKPLGELYELNF